MRILFSVVFVAAAFHSAVAVCAVEDTPRRMAVELGPRPYFLVEQLAPGPLKTGLQACARKRRAALPNDFSIGHRGAPRLFPEHTEESYRAAAGMGAGILECDITFTRDRQLVCRHDQCDLHDTTNILETPLVEKCTVLPPAPDGAAGKIRCCTSDLTLAEFKTLEGRMDAAGPSAAPVDDYLAAGSSLRREFYDKGRGTLMTLAEAIELFGELGVGMTPELKTPKVAMPFEGDFTQQAFARQAVEELIAAGVDPERVWLQSFLYEDVLYWLEAYPAFGRQAVFLDSRYTVDVNSPAEVAAMAPSLSDMAADGVRFVAPPLFMLLGVDEERIVPSAYAREANRVGLGLIGWTTERSARLEQGGGGFYYQTVKQAIRNDGDILTVIDVLAQDVGVKGLFSDWPATTTFYANCRRELERSAPVIVTGTAG